MSKAFTKEDVDLDLENESDPEDSSPLPPGGKYYITPAGARKLQEEFRRLKYEDRPKVVATVTWAAGNGDRSENADYQYGKRKLREIDRRLRFLSKRLAVLEVVDPLIINATQVLFGATVTIRDEEDKEQTYSIVGVDEVDVSQGRISWVSPLGAALLKSSVGDLIVFRSPKGTKEIEILRIRYIQID